jgi:glucokinase
MDYQYYVGCDLGGTNIKAGLVDMSTGKVVATKGSLALSHEGPEKVIKRVGKTVQQLLSENNYSWDTVGGVGVSVPSQFAS